MDKNNLALIEMTVFQKTKQVDNYTGSIRLDGVEIYYSFNALIPLQILNNAILKRQSIDDLRLIFQLKIWTEDKTFRLNDEEYVFFFDLIFPQIVKFISDPDIQAGNNLDYQRVLVKYTAYSIKKPLKQYIVLHRIFIFETPRSEIPCSLIDKIIA